MAMKEQTAVSFSGWLALLGGIGAILLAVLFVGATDQVTGLEPLLGALLAFAGMLLLAGCAVIAPNEARVLTFFGHYTGSVKQSGLRWMNPLTRKTPISLRARNFETAKIKVNDLDGNPIEIGAVIVWRVIDTAQASFDVESYVAYVQIQAESALRNLAMQHPYDTQHDDAISLRGQSEAVASLLRKEVNDRIRAAGCEVVDARIAHLAYAPEIAQAMLQRQQAGAIIAARQRIVEGAVSMVEMALEQLSQRHIVELDAERKAAMVSNLLVVLCGERATQPVVNAGSLY